VEESVKGFLVPGLVFEELGFRYIGPVDGHNLSELITTLRNIKDFKGPVILHISTLKGKGYKPAEQDPERFHKVEPFDITSGAPRASQAISRSPARTKVLARPAAETFTDAFSDELVRLGEADKKVMVLTAAMPEGTGVVEFTKRWPDRCIDVGMAEQHAVGLAAGMARGGLKPVVAIYSTFMQRAYDQIMHELCLQELPTVLALDRASLVGEDGPTHHGIFDIAYLRVLPNIIVISPKDPAELRAMLQWGLEQPRTVALRYARGGIVCGEPLGKPAKLVLGKSEPLRQGKDLTLLALGSMVYPALKVAEDLAGQGIEAAVVNARFVKPLDLDMVRQAAATGGIVTLEEAQIAGGFGSAVSEALGELGLPPVPHLRVGLADEFIEHGKRHELLKLCRLDPESLTKRILQWLRADRTAADRPSDELRLFPESSAA
jgi:1-deoxy-D-xylulose-5-phosphate synthase